MLLRLASCLAIPGGVLDGWSLQEWPWVFVHRIIEICHILSRFPSFLPVSIHELNSFWFLTVSLSLLSLPLRTWSGFLPVECIRKCEKWFDHHIFGHPSSLSSLLLSWIAYYLTKIYMYRKKAQIYWQRSIHNYYNLPILWSVDVHPWVMVHQVGMGYGIWESLAHLAGNQRQLYLISIFSSFPLKGCTGFMAVNSAGKEACEWSISILMCQFIKG